MKSSSQVDKGRLLQALRERVEADLAALTRRQRDIQQGATHAESRAEHAKDTRATEQSYLARGLADRVREARKLADVLASVPLRRFHGDDAIAVTCLVTLRDEAEGEEQLWWIVPGPAGVELSLDGSRIQTVTPAAPLGRALLGLHVGDEGTLASPAGERSFEIIGIA